MLRKLAEELSWTVSLNLQIAKRRLTGFGREYYRDGFAAGHAAGRKHASLAGPDIPEPGMSGHPQTELEGIEVDVLMAPLLRAMWSLGLDTQYSCQGDPDRYFPHDPLFNQSRTQIVFADFDQACKFAKKTMELLGSAAYTEGRH